MLLLADVYAAVRHLLPFEWVQPTFMIHALAITALLAPLCAALGVKVVNFRMAFFSDAISHSAFTGVVLGYLLTPFFERAYPGATRWDLVLPPLTLVLFGLLVGGLITAVRHRTDLSTDTVIGVFFASVIALGIVVISRNNLQGNFERYLYGYIVTATAADVWLTAGLALVVLTFLALSFNRLMLIGLNDSLARSRGIRARAYDYAFSLLLALVVTVSIRTVGLLLVTAMLIVPAAAARNIARSAGGMFWWAAIIGLACGVGGLITSYYAETAPGATMILMASVVFLVTMAAAWLRNLPRGTASPAV